jgi:hypothetical protein
MVGGFVDPWLIWAIGDIAEVGLLWGVFGISIQSDVAHESDDYDQDDQLTSLLLAVVPPREHDRTIVGSKTSASIVPVTAGIILLTFPFKYGSVRTATFGLAVQSVVLAILSVSRNNSLPQLTLPSDNWSRGHRCIVCPLAECNACAVSDF